MRRLALAVAVLLLSLGTGLVVYGVSVDRGDFRSPLGLSLWQQPAEVTAWGAGTLVAGFVLFVVAIRNRTSRAG